jgi:hypothetical protein
MDRHRRRVAGVQHAVNRDGRDREHLTGPEHARAWFVA